MGKNFKCGKTPQVSSAQSSEQAHVKVLASAGSD